MGIFSCKYQLDLFFFFLKKEKKSAMTHFLLYLNADEEVESKHCNGKGDNGIACHCLPCHCSALTPRVGRSCKSWERARRAATLITLSHTHSTQDNTSYHSDADTVATKDIASAWWGYIKECISVQSNETGKRNCFKKTIWKGEKKRRRPIHQNTKLWIRSTH